MFKSDIVTCSVPQSLQQLGQPPANENNFERSAYCLLLLTFASLSSRSLDFFIRSSQKKRFMGTCPLEMTRKMRGDNLPLWKWKWKKNTFTNWSCPFVWPNSTNWSSYVGSHGKRRTGSFEKNLSNVKHCIAFTTIEDIASRGEKKHIYQGNLKRPRRIWFKSYLASCTGNTATFTWLKQTIYCPSEVCYCLFVLFVFELPFIISSKSWRLCKILSPPNQNVIIVNGLPPKKGFAAKSKY